MGTLDAINEVARKRIFPGLVNEVMKENALLNFLRGRNRFKMKCFDLFFYARKHGYGGGLYSTWNGARDRWK